MNNDNFHGSSMHNDNFHGSSMHNDNFHGSSMYNDNFHGSSMNKVLITTKNINKYNYMVIGIDDNRPVLYVYKDGDLFDWHLFGATYAQEMHNLINCYITVHGHEPSIQMINEFRCFCKALKDKNYN